MYERRYGEKYKREGDAGAYLSAADIAKMMRVDIKAAQAEGVLPADLKVSVTVENYSGGRSIDFNVPFRPEFWTECHGYYDELRRDGEVSTRVCGGSWYLDHEPAGPSAPLHNVLSVEGQRVKRVLEGIHGAYNYNGSEVQVDYFDVNYYGTVTMTTEESAGFQARERARKAQMRADADERKALIAFLAQRTIYKAGRLRQQSTERLRAMRDSIEARV